MADSELRALERRANNGDGEAKGLLRAMKLRLGLIRVLTEGEIREFFKELIKAHPSDRFYDFHNTTISVKKLEGLNSIEVTIDSMYECALAVSFEVLKKIGKFFGTDAVDVDDWASYGCGTCDWGSSYGHSFQIYDCKVEVQWSGPSS